MELGDKDKRDDEVSFTLFFSSGPLCGGVLWAALYAWVSDSLVRFLLNPTLPLHRPPNKLQT
ncbi:hypothetical protein PILCRDRAFT_812465 [Piloderma croceum F 1598]|uniref:Uncharacterized protein n=1 Tax=Piloderma croceum (strain F 1598) TaxID=765440 RepID=A0A0C3CIX8_PILCF|nr:hypothetical protein PILCRDRAFT_812465 [Piloderma croceum F 1598]